MVELHRGYCKIREKGTKGLQPLDTENNIRPLDWEAIEGYVKRGGYQPRGIHLDKILSSVIVRRYQP